MHRAKQQYRTNTNLTCNRQDNSGRNKLKAMALDCRCRAGKEAMRVGGDGYLDICLPHLAGCTFRVCSHNVIASASRVPSTTTAVVTVWWGYILSDYWWVSIADSMVHKLPLPSLWTVFSLFTFFRLLAYCFPRPEQQRSIVFCSLSHQHVPHGHIPWNL